MVKKDDLLQMFDLHHHPLGDLQDSSLHPELLDDDPSSDFYLLCLSLLFGD
jgi:hypothetical protein